MTIQISPLRNSRYVDSKYLPTVIGLCRDKVDDSTFQSSSSLLICWAVIWRALSCSCSDGILTNQERKQRSWIRGCHCELSQLMSFRLLWLAHGCLCYNQSKNVKCRLQKILYSFWWPSSTGRSATWNHPYLHSNTTTESAFAGMKPSRKTLRQPQL